MPGGIYRAGDWRRRLLLNRDLSTAVAAVSVFRFDGILGSQAHQTPKFNRRQINTDSGEKPVGRKMLSFSEKFWHFPVRDFAKAASTSPWCFRALAVAVGFFDAEC
jgi:hypothetical protein